MSLKQRGHHYDSSWLGKSLQRQRWLRTAAIEVTTELFLNYDRAVFIDLKFIRKSILFLRKINFIDFTREKRVKKLEKLNVS